MPLRSVYAKTVYDRRHGLLWWSIGIGLLTVTVQKEAAEWVQYIAAATVLPLISLAIGAIVHQCM